MRRALLAFSGLLGLYGCYDYTLPTRADADPKTRPVEKSDGGPTKPTPSHDANASDAETAPVIPPDTTVVDAGADAAGQCPPAGIKCANGCVNGTCNPPTACVAGGSYCGGDKVNGDPNVLYKCGGDGFATTIQQSCANGCTVAPAGQDDYCN